MQHIPGENKLRNTLKAGVYRLFNDDLMIGLAAVLAYIVVLQLLFEVSPAMQTIFKYVNYAIIAAFVAEYVLKLYVAESRGSFVTNPLHVLDLLIILLALFDFSRLELVSYILPNQNQLSPILRLLRILPRILPRVLLAFILAGRTAERVIPSKYILPPPEQSELQIAILDVNGHVNKCLTIESSCSIASNGQPLWMDFQHIKKIDLDLIANTTGIPNGVLESKLIRESFPRIDYFKNIPTILLWDSRVKSVDKNNNEFDIKTNDVLVACTDGKIITLSTGKSDLFDRISGQGLPLEKEEFAIRVLYSLLRQKIDDYGEIVQGIERKTFGFEEIPANRTSPQFLEETFRFKKEIQKIISNLWHFNQVLHHIKDDKNLLLKGIDDNHSHNFDDLHAESEYMYETAQNIRDSLVSLIELHINTMSYDMNRVMKVIAVITCLAIIPSIIGGLLGVNLIDNPYPLKIAEIFLIVFSLMLLGLYAFYKMGWLR